MKRGFSHRDTGTRIGLTVDASDCAAARGAGPAATARVPPTIPWMARARVIFMPVHFCVQLLRSVIATSFLPKTIRRAQ